MSVLAACIAAVNTCKEVEIIMVRILILMHGPCTCSLYCCVRTCKELEIIMVRILILMHGRACVMLKRAILSVRLKICSSGGGDAALYEVKVRRRRMAWKTGVVTITIIKQ